MTTKQFDGVSFIKQTKSECILHLRLCSMKTARSGFPPKLKPTNTELPPCERSGEFLTVTAQVREEDGAAATTYEWSKRHQDKITGCKIKVEKDELLELKLTKSDSKEWLRSFIEYLLEL